MWGGGFRVILATAPGRHTRQGHNPRPAHCPDAASNLNRVPAGCESNHEGACCASSVTVGAVTNPSRPWRVSDPERPWPRLVHGPARRLRVIQNPVGRLDSDLPGPTASIPALGHGHGTRRVPCVARLGRRFKWQLGWTRMPTCGAVPARPLPPPNRHGTTGRVACLLLHSHARARAHLLALLHANKGRQATAGAPCGASSQPIQTCNAV